jgi:hypothetical protein
MADSTFDFNLFLKESKDVLVNPKSYFSTMKTTGGMTEPLIKAVIYGAIAGIIAFVWSILNLGSFGNSLFGGAFGIMILIGKIIWSIIGLFLGAVVLLVVSSICKGNTDFEANVRVTAALMVIMPIMAFLGFTVHIHYFLFTIINFAIYLYSLWLLYNGLVGALKANPETSKIVIYVLIAITVVVIIFSTIALGRTYRMMKDFNHEGVSELYMDVRK